MMLSAAGTASAARLSMPAKFTLHKKVCKSLYRFRCKGALFVKLRGHISVERGRVISTGSYGDMLNEGLDAMTDDLLVLCDQPWAFPGDGEYVLTISPQLRWDAFSTKQAGQTVPTKQPAGRVVPIAFQPERVSGFCASS